MRKNKKDKKQDINYLDLIPETNQSIRWHRDLKQRIILEIENKGMQDLALLVKEHFGDKAEPLYPRIVKYFQIMESYEFVHFINKKTDK